MSTQCFTTCGKVGFCLKHVPKVKVEKKLYMSYKLREKNSKMAVAIETIVTKTPISYGGFAMAVMLTVHLMMTIYAARTFGGSIISLGWTLNQGRCQASLVWLWMFPRS